MYIYIQSPLLFIHINIMIRVFAYYIYGSK